MKLPLAWCRGRAALLGIACLAALSLRAAEPGVSIIYDGRTTAYSRAELAMLPHQEVTAFDFHDQKNHTYSGVPVRDLLAKAGVPFGEKLRGKFLRMAVIAHTRDNYDSVYALAEFDDAFNSRTILLVDRQDGEPLGDALAPARLVIPGDKRPARWAHMVTSLEVVSVGNPGPRPPKPATPPPPAP
jgi:hypothetical protein